MKTIGLIGGMSWESTLEYYRLINQKIHDRLGGFHSARCVLVSVDFFDVEILQRESRWGESAELMVSTAHQLQQAGAECIVLCTNTMHIVAEKIQTSVNLPFLHIADATGRAIQDRSIRTVGLLGTRFTMEGDFIRGRLETNFGLRVLIPNPSDRNQVHRVIYEELVCGIIKDESRQVYLEIIRDLIARGAEGIILGCTEIGMLIRAHDLLLPVFDTTLIHAQAAVDFALGA